MADEIVGTEVLEKRLSALNMLMEMTCQLAVDQNLDRILKLVTTQVCDALNCERASLFLYDATQKELYTRVVTELEIDEIRLSLDVGVTGWVATHRQLANIPDPPLDPRWSSRFDRETGFRTENILTIPLISRHNERLVGVLQLLNKERGSFDEFDEHVVQAFGSHAASALERSQLLEELRTKQTLEASLAIARDIQAGFLPQQLEKRPGYDVAAWWQPAEGVGGDYYDVVPLADGRLGIAMADVSGHGVGPSLIMASARAMLHILARTASEPERILTTLSESIAPDLQDGRFITFFLGALDTKKHRFRFANAGHAPVVHFEHREERFHPLEATGFPLGVCPEVPVTAGGAVTMQPGDILLLATDGTIELHNKKGQMFGVERLRKIVQQHHALSAQDLVTRVRTELIDFHEALEPDDDITLLVVKRTA